MKVFILLSIIVLVSIHCYCETQYNAMENRWELTSGDEELKYNAMDNEWTYEKENSTLEYNAFEDEWGYVEDNQDSY